MEHTTNNTSIRTQDLHVQYIQLWNREVFRLEYWEFVINIQFLCTVFFHDIADQGSPLHPIFCIT